MNPFFNQEEYRPRALIRLIIFVFVSILIMGSSTTVYFFGFEYLIAGALLAGFFWVMFRFVDQRDSISESGILLSKEWMNEFAIGTLAGGLVMLMIFLLEWSSGDISIEGFVWNRTSSVFWLIPVVGYLIKMLSIGFYEELISRSYLIPNIKEGFTVGKINPAKATIIAIALSSILFGTGHMGNPNVSIFATINIIFAGVMLAIPYVLTGRLSYSVGLHFSWNYFQGGVFGFRVSGIEHMHSIISIKQFGNPLWTGGSFGPEGGLIGLVGIFLILTLIAGYIKKKEGKLELHHTFKSTFRENKERLRKADELA
ncbi:MAG: CPBP family intramembrane metalloprotease [Balneolaceae bacterium]|nr:CPBP family intramembrane metalloprotease [Balneolaceae bacterium]MBO6545337.1 CPBP family intramembrane metalloprotease [Balneolaceae bacterium]MBO6646733.1 CPBP family intramembrane metalloprotease [Balneolaceae bacterium]